MQSSVDQHVIQAVVASLYALIFCFIFVAKEGEVPISARLKILFAVWIVLQLGASMLWIVEIASLKGWWYLLTGSRRGPPALGLSLPAIFLLFLAPDMFRRERGTEGPGRGG